jgi:hypothetical protein
MPGLRTGEVQAVILATGDLNYIAAEKRFD